jgi:hypothetical protein
MAELKKRYGILPAKQKEVRLQRYCEKFVGELKKPGLQHEFEAALLTFTLKTTFHRISVVLVRNVVKDFTRIQRKWKEIRRWMDCEHDGRLLLDAQEV